VIKLGIILNQNKNVAVGTDNVVVSEAVFGAKRRLLTLVNTGATNITISFTQEAVANQGVVLYPTGSFTDGSLTQASQDSINAISSALGGTLAVYERIEA
jgi:hypothetical protein